MSKLESFIAKSKTQTETIRVVAKEFGALMDSLSVGELSAGGVQLRLSTKRASGGGTSDDLEMLAIDDYSGEAWVCVEVNPSASRETGYHYGDMCCTFIRPTRGDLITFAKAVPALLDKLLGDIDSVQNDIDNADMLIAETKTLL